MTRVIFGVCLIIFIFVLLTAKLWTVGSVSNVKTEWSLVLGGDVMIGRSVTVTSLDDKKDPKYPFLGIGNILKTADLSFVNLETPITQNCPRRTTGMIFCAPPSMLEGLTYSGVDIVNLSNNHTENYGTSGYNQTISNLLDKGIPYTSNTNLVIKKIGEIRVGFIGFDKDQLSNPTLTEEEKDFIKDSKSKVNMLIVAMHWGIEYHAHPTEGQRKLAKQIISLGADVIVGHHPHWVQDIEYIDGKPVYYSLGNLVFDQPWSEETKKGLMIKLTFNGITIKNEEKLPVYMKNLGQPILSNN